MLSDTLHQQQVDPDVREAAVAGRDSGWTAALQRALAEPQCVRVHYQPIVDLQRGVVRGYEALARFPESAGVSPRDWFDAAARLGFAGALEAQLLQAALVTRPLLVKDRFVAVNLSPVALVSDEVQTVLAAERTLEQLVVELVDREDGADPAEVARTIGAIRSRGVMLAVDGSDADGCHVDRVNAMRPHFVKVDGGLIGGVEHDDQRAQTVRALSEFATRLGAWVVAEGVETQEQLDALIRLRVPLGQGYALGHPAAVMGELDREVAGRMRRCTLAGVSVERIGGMVEDTPQVPLTAGAPGVAAGFAASPEAEAVVLLAADGLPSGVLDRSGHARGNTPRTPLCLPASTPVADAARQAMARPAPSRFDPIIVVDPCGTALGIAPIDRIVRVLAR